MLTHQLLPNGSVQITITADSLPVLLMFENTPTPTVTRVTERGFHPEYLCQRCEAAPTAFHHADSYQSHKNA